jgi:hypothetical protein
MLMRSHSSLIDCCDRLIVAGILHMLIKEDGCVSGVTKRDGVVRFLRKRNWITSKLHELRRPWNCIMVFHGRCLCHDSEPRQLLPGRRNTGIRTTMSHCLKEVVKLAVVLW